MAHYNDMSSDHTKWSKAKLLREIRKYANMESFSVGYNEIEVAYNVGWHEQVNKNMPSVEDFCREQTRIYRESWLNPLIDELERRFCK
jgi:hypothetical protein